jgi:rare lipoprotein A
MVVTIAMAAAVHGHSQRIHLPSSRSVWTARLRRPRSNDSAAYPRGGDFGRDDDREDHKQNQPGLIPVEVGESGILIGKSIVAASAVCLIFCGAARAETGLASVYFHTGGKTASGERAHTAGMTAARRTLPFGTLVEVTNRRNGKSVVVRINDRGPFIRGRVIDVTPAAAQALGFSGLAPVTLAVSARTGRGEVTPR